MGEELKACPLCHKMEGLSVANHNHYGIPATSKARVSCDLCCLDLFAPTIEQAKSRWNRRAPSPAAKALADAVERHCFCKVTGEFRQPCEWCKEFPNEVQVALAAFREEAGETEGPTECEVIEKRIRDTWESFRLYGYSIEYGGKILDQRKVIFRKPAALDEK